MRAAQRPASISGSPSSAKVFSRSVSPAVTLTAVFGKPNAFAIAAAAALLAFPFPAAPSRGR